MKDILYRKNYEHNEWMTELTKLIFWISKKIMIICSIWKNKSKNSKNDNNNMFQSNKNIKLKNDNDNVFQYLYYNKYKIQKVKMT